MVIYGKRLVPKVKNYIDKAGRDTDSMLGFYRYISWLTTSLFYFLGPPESNMVFKAGVITALFAAIHPTLRFYRTYGSSRGNLIKMIIIETLGIALLLVPTGGLGSPFMWYALNPVLVAACYLPFFVGLLNLMIYLLFSCVVTSYSSNLGVKAIVFLLQEQLPTLLAFLLITFAFQLHSRLTETLRIQALGLHRGKQEVIARNKELAQANKAIQKYLAYIKDLYQAVEAFCSKDNIEELAELFVKYACKLTGVDSIVFLVENRQKPADSFWKATFSSTIDEVTAKTLINRLIDYSRQIRMKPLPVSTVDLAYGATDYKLICVPVRSSSRHYGVLAGFTENQLGDDSSQVEQSLIFLGQISAVVLERIRLEKISDEQLLIEEQNRIADEIHDTVTQRLFSVSMAVHSLAVTYHNIEATELEDRLRFVKKTVIEAARELKESIYRLSSRKKDEQAFAGMVNTYLNELSKLNGIKVSLQIQGAEDLLSSPLRIAFFRIIREATGNAVKHAQCRNLDVRLRISQDSVTLIISDDGTGFEISEKKKDGKGLGLRNMERVARSVHGSFSVKSQIGKGTVISCFFPLAPMDETITIETEVV